jgi:hypothetical protein
LTKEKGERRKEKGERRKEKRRHKDISDISDKIKKYA